MVKAYRYGGSLDEPNEGGPTDDALANDYIVSTTTT
jgi:hypothetical protein